MFAYHLINFNNVPRVYNILCTNKQIRFKTVLDMSYSHFIDQVQILMHTQQVRHAEAMYDKSRNYAWLSNKKCVLTFMTAKDEFLLRQALQKVNQEQQIKTIRQILSWLDEHPNAQANKVPEMCVSLLNKYHTINIINEATFSRKNSFRNSLKRLSIISNKVAPAPELLTPSMKRCVKFNDKPTIYCITQ